MNPVYYEDMDMLAVERGSGPQPVRMTLGSDDVVIHATSADTGGTLFAVEITMPPGGGPPVMHRHDPGEVYLVLDGEFTFYTQEPNGEARRRTACAGEVVSLAGGTPHTIRNESAEPARAFAVHAPGGPMEGFMRAVAEQSRDQPPAMERVLAIASLNGITLLGPIPDVTS